MVRRTRMNAARLHACGSPLQIDETPTPTAWAHTASLDDVLCAVIRGVLASIAVVDHWIWVTIRHVRSRAARCARSRSERAVVARPRSREFPAGARVHRVVAVVRDKRTWRGAWLARLS